MRSFSVRENWALYELGWQRIKATDCIIKVVILRGNSTWRSFALRDWAYKQISAWQPLLPSAKGLSFTLCIYFYARVKVFSLFLFIFLLWQASCDEERSRHICLVEYGWHELLLLTSALRWVSFYVSGWNVLLMCMRWVLAIIEDYMMVEYVDLPKGYDTWPFLKRWWIVVAKLTENIVCWFSVEFMLYTSMLWWIVTCSWEVIW